MPPDTQIGKPGTTFWPRARLLLVGLVFCRGLVLLCLLPPFEGWDEYQHVAYVEQIRETGRSPVFGETLISSDLLAEIVEFPLPRAAAAQLRASGAVDYDAFWARRDPERAGDRPRAFRGGASMLYQAQHSSLAYRLAAPVYAGFGGMKDLRSSVGALRVANLLLTCGAAWVVLGGFRRILQNDRDAALAGLALATHPTFLMNGARVANDALGLLLASATVVIGLGLIVSPRSPRRFAVECGGLGLLVGLAVTAKATNFGLVPFAAFAWLAGAMRAKVPAGRAVLCGVLMAAGCLAVVQSDLRSNLAQYGSLTAMQEGQINARGGVTRADLWRTAGSFDWPEEVARLWSRRLFFTGGWSFLNPSPPGARIAYAYAVAAGLLGWAGWAVATVIARVRKVSGPEPALVSPWALAACLVVVAGYNAAMAYHMVQSKMAWGGPTTNPWYACPALPWFLAAVVGGGLSWPLGRWLRPAVPLALSGVGLCTEGFSQWIVMAPAYTGGASGGTMLRRLAWLQPGFLGTPTLAVAIVAEVAVVAVFALLWLDAARSARTEPTPQPAP